MSKMQIDIRNNSTGEIRTIEDDARFYQSNGDVREQEDGDIEDLFTYMWDEGNYSCDCNRRSYFEGHYVEDSPCGEEAFSVRVRYKGEVAYNELEEAPDDSI